MPSEPLLRLLLCRALSAFAVVALCAACGGPPPRTANPARPLDERRALAIIAETFRAEQEEPVAGSDVSLSPQHRLHVDVLAQGKRFGVAYVTANERGLLGRALPPRDPGMSDALQLVSGIGADADARVLVLYDADYLYDDETGEAHEKSTVTAELKLRRDVRDFLVCVHAGKCR
jgi:hypothetical protein